MSGMRLRAMPLVFRAAIVMLAAAVGIGQYTGHQAAGPLGKDLLAATIIRCPAASARLPTMTVGDVEHATDQAMRWALADRLAPRAQPRCTASRGAARRDVDKRSDIK